MIYISREIRSVRTEERRPARLPVPEMPLDSLAAVHGGIKNLTHGRRDVLIKTSRGLDNPILLYATAVGYVSPDAGFVSGGVSSH